MLQASCLTASSDGLAMDAATAARPDGAEGASLASEVVERAAAEPDGRPETFSSFLITDWIGAWTWATLRSSKGIPTMMSLSAFARVGGIVNYLLSLSAMDITSSAWLAGFPSFSRLNSVLR